MNGFRSLWTVRREPGFRFNLRDLIFLVFLAGLCYLIWTANMPGPLWPLPAYLGLSFFLFCNVFRIGDALEAVWYVPFTVVAVMGILWPGLLWPMVFLFMEPLKIILIIHRIRKGPYVGVWHKRLARYASVSEFK